MSVSYVLLGILSREPNYGYDLKRVYDAVFGSEKTLAFGQVYATLARLRRDHRISIEEDEQTMGPARKKYTITALGRTELEDWLALPEEPRQRSHVTLFAKVVASILLDKSPNEYLDVQRASHMAKMRILTRQRQEGDLKQSLQADYTLFHLEADLRWIDITAKRLEILTREIQSAT